ncbi:glycolate oxidase subunit GlcE [Oxalobacteraceae bacterium CAVE-383]|nr:glycolate oxidase subunit GlcE [Oxalobacteraceae bacterium CAVE-383]
MELILQNFKEQILAGRPLRIRGGASKDWYGQTPQGELLDTRAYAGIVDYEPTELVVTARCGTPLAEIEAALAANNQMLAFEPPHFGPGATVGGMIACGLSGPARQAVGAARDFVLGAVLMDGAGDVLHFGGQVMKNVAGYDVARLLAGSLGCLGLILEVSIKVLPLPFASASLRFQMGQAEAIRRLNEWGGRPLPISASAWCDEVLTLRLSGAQAAVDAACVQLGGERLAPEQAAAFWRDLREQRLAFFDPANFDAAPLWRLSVPSAGVPIASPGMGPTLIEWGGAQRWLREPADVDAARMRAIAAAAGGHAAMFRGGDKEQGVFQPLQPAVEKIHRKLKASFDPNGIFNCGRMYPRL